MSVDLADVEDLLEFSLDEDQTVSSLIETGTLCENIASVNAELLDGTTLHLAVKTTHEVSTEVTFYNVILPTLRFFQENEELEELNFIPTSYGGRNLSNRSILILEDLNVQKFKNAESFDLATTRQILKDLASFHAIPLALKLKDPKVFDTKIRRYVQRKEGVNTQHIAQVLKTIEEDPDYAPYVDKIKEKLITVTEKAARAPFSTMIHNKFIFRNIMVKVGPDGFAEIRVVDFQHCNYGSVAEDLILFLYTSVDVEVLEEHCDGLIEFYHSNFVRVLEECKCDPTPFGLDALLKEMKIVTNESQFVHVLVTLCAAMKGQSAGGEVKRRLLFAVGDLVKRNWA